MSILGSLMFLEMVINYKICYRSLSSNDGNEIEYQTHYCHLNTMFVLVFSTLEHVITLMYELSIGFYQLTSSFYKSRTSNQQ